MLPSRRTIGRIVLVLAWLNLTGLLTIWLIVLTAQPSWWPVTLYCSTPRWVWVLPTLVIAPLSLMFGLRAFVPLVLAGFVVALPIVGYRPEFLASGSSRHDPMAVRVRVLTCNMGEGFLDAKGMAGLIERDDIEVALLQQAILSFAQQELIFPKSKGWTFSDGGKDWNDLNLVVATRLPLRSMGFLDHALMDAPGVAGRYEIEVRGSLVRFVNLEMPTIQPGLMAIAARKFEGLAELSNVVAGQTRAVLSVRKWMGHGEIPLLVGGDLNVTEDNPVYRTGWGGFENAFGTVGHGFGYTTITKFVGFRVDHILTGPGWRANWCRVGPDIGTKHQPVTAEMEWVGPSTVFPNR